MRELRTQTAKPQKAPASPTTDAEDELEYHDANHSDANNPFYSPNDTDNEK